MSGIVHSTLDAKFQGSPALDIYKILGIGNEWMSFLRTFNGVSKPEILPKSKVNGNMMQPTVKQPRIASHTQGGVDFTIRELDVSDLMMFTELEPNDWKGSFPEFQPTGDRLNLEMAPEIYNTILDAEIEKLQREIGLVNFQGNTSNPDLTSGTLEVGRKYVITSFEAGDNFTNVGAASNATGVEFVATGTTPTTWTNSSQLNFASTDLLIQYDGFKTLMAADGDVTDVASVGATITLSNVLGILQDIVNAIPKRLWSKRASMPILMSTTDYLLAMEADKLTQQNSTLLNTSAGTSIDGHLLVPMDSIPVGQMMCTIVGTGADSNLTNGVWFETDNENFIMYREQPGDDQWAVLLKFHMGVQYRSGEDIFSYIAA